MRSGKRRARRLLPALYLVAVFLFAGGPEARAANEDFIPNYDFSPDMVGYLGADMDLLLIVENTGPTDITWVGVGIDTQTPYTGRWNCSPPIRPGTTRRRHFTVPFAPGDLDETRTMQVTMNNDGDAGADGSKTFRFIKRSTRNIFTVSSSISPPGPYHPGQTVTVTTQLHYNMDSDATGVNMESILRQGSAILIMPPTSHLGLIMPGGHPSSVVTYTLRDEDVGRVDFECMLHATISGRNYALSNVTLHFDVADRSPPPSTASGGREVAFTASLSAEPTALDAGGTVNFRVTVHNTGHDDIGGFEITSMGGATELTVEGMDAGADGSVVISKTIGETCDVSFIVIGRAGSTSVSIPTNTVHITVGEPLPEVSPASPTPSAATAAETPTPEATIEPSASAPIEAAVSESPAQAGQTPAPAQAQPLIGIPKEALLAIIGALLLAILVLLVLLLTRKRKAKVQ